MENNDHVELYKKYRPTSFADLVGQREAVQMLVNFGKRNTMPHFLLLAGPAGTGKTTIARILRKKLGCSDLDYKEVNAAQNRGIDMVRDIEARIGAAPIGGKCRVWTCDECALLTHEAQSAFLKILEDTPRHVHFIFCTTDPHKLKQTIRTRATIVTLHPVKNSDMLALVNKVADAESMPLGEDVADKIVEAAGGSCRQALVLLNQVAGVDDGEEQLALIERNIPERDAVEICKMLLNGRTTWGTMASFLKGLEKIDDQAESIRWLVLSWMKSVALGGGKGAGRAVMVIDAFRDNFYDCKAAGLVAACHEVIVGE